MHLPCAKNNKSLQHCFPSCPAIRLRTLLSFNPFPRPAMYIRRVISQKSNNQPSIRVLMQTTNIRSVRALHQLPPPANHVQPPASIAAV